VLEAESLAVFYRDGQIVRHEGGESKSGGADPMAFTNDAHKALIVDFLDSVEQGTEPTVSGREALKVHVLIEALLQSSTTGAPVAIA
jgi:UDP-N-acetyl-2-amino-2-deoxyglucuronate dehydrogenase